MGRDWSRVVRVIHNMTWEPTDWGSHFSREEVASKASSSNAQTDFCHSTCILPLPAISLFDDVTSACLDLDVAPSCSSCLRTPTPFLLSHFLVVAPPVFLFNLHLYVTYHSISFPSATGTDSMRDLLGDRRHSEDVQVTQLLQVTMLTYRQQTGMWSWTKLLIQG